MEDIEEAIQGETENYTPVLLESKKYELKYKEDIYSLLIERYSDDYIQFELKKSNNISLYHYKNKYKYNDITKILSLQKEYQQDSSKVHCVCSNIIYYFKFKINKNDLIIELF